MTERKSPELEDLDLLAYADGWLDAEPARRDEVERRINASVELRERVAAYRAQSAALHRAYDHRAREPVPAHLLAILEKSPRPLHRTTAGIAAVITLMLCAGLFGWLLGRGGYSGGFSSSGEDFLARSYDYYIAPTAAAGMTHPTDAKLDNWLSQKLSLTLHAPDLTGSGYTVVNTRTIDNGEDEDMLRLTYAGPEGLTFSLFLYPRRQEGPRGIRMVREGGVSLAYWLEGPLASVIASRLPPGETRAISEAVRRSMTGGDGGRPRLAPATPPGGKIAGGPALPDNRILPLHQPAMPEPASGMPKVIPN